MLYHLLYPLAEHVTFFNLFRYITFRSGGAVMTALFICFVFGPRDHPLAQGQAERRPADPRRRPGDRIC